MENIPLIVIVGPTAVGKTALAVALAQKINGEIISADSMQVYKYMDIGTAKPSMEERGGIKHYLIDEVEPTVDYNVVKYVTAAHKYIRSVYKSGKIPILAGGTGLYIDSVVNNTQFAETIAEKDYRQELMALANQHGNQYVYDMLKAVDPKTAEKIHINDLRRIIRALEVYKFTGTAMSAVVEKSHLAPTPYDVVTFGLTMERDQLYERINARVDYMMAKGLIEEVESLLKMGLTRENTSMNGIGYKELLDFFEGNLTLEDAVELIKKNSRNYAKRQYTWFNKNENINWMVVTPYTRAESMASSCYNYLQSFRMI